MKKILKKHIKKAVHGNSKKTAKDMTYVSRVNPFPKFDW
jgi:hypothetical protein